MKSSFHEEFYKKFRLREMKENSDHLRYDLGDFAYGTWRILDDEQPLSCEALVRRFHKCLENNINTIDTAEIYGDYHVEEAVGDTLKSDPELLNRFKIVTKAGINVP